LQLAVTFGVLTIFGAMITKLEINRLSLTAFMWGVLVLVVVKECVLALWAVAFSGLLCEIYLHELPEQQDA